MSPAPLFPRGVPIEELGLPARVLRKLQVDGVIKDTFDIMVLSPLALSQMWNLTRADVDRINQALAARGMRTMEHSPDRPPPKPKGAGCPEILSLEPVVKCGRVKLKGKRQCVWHWLLKIPISEQLAFLDAQAARRRARPEHVERARVPREEWPAGGRWCSECQAFVPDIYVSGSKCKGHASRASHASMIKRVYDLTGDEYEALLAWQGGRCYICGQYPRAKRLAVDHDHRTNAVRGLLCANDEWGCNSTLRRLLNSLEMAQRAFEYVQMPPYDRMRLEMQDAPVPEEPQLASAAEPWNPFA